MEKGIYALIFWLMVLGFLFPIAFQAIVSFMQLHEMESKSPYKKKSYR
jgi:hypothetical protein